MAEIILPPEENEETPQTPELNIDKPTTNSKVITIEFEAKKTNKVSTKDTNQQLYTTDTDAWFEFKETTLENANGTYSVVFRNRHDGSIFQRTGDVVNGVAYYKIPHQEIRHAGAWRGQIVYTLSNGDTTAREFGYDVKGHILDGKDVREIVVEDFETLMSQLRNMKDNAELELAGLVNTANQNETDRQAFFDDLVEDIDDLQANYQELLDTGVLQTNINTKLEALEEEYAPKLTEVTAQLAQIALNALHPPSSLQPLVADGNYYDQENFKYYSDEDMTVPATDNTPAMQKLVDYLYENGGGTIYLPKGKYVFRDTITWKSNVSLVGAGRGSTYLFSEGVIFSLIDRSKVNGSDGSAADNPDFEWLEDCTFRDFAIDAKGLSSTVPSVSGKALFLLFMKRAVFRDLTLLNTIGTALGCDFLVDTVIDNIYVRNAGRNGKDYGGNSGIGVGTSALSKEPLVISNCFIYDCGNYGIFVETQKATRPETFYAKVVNCHVEGNSKGFGNKGSGGTQFIGCTAVENLRHGFHLTQASYGDQIIACVANKNGEHGISVDTTYKGALDISNVKANGNGGNGIAINVSVTTIWMKDVIISNIQTRGNGHNGVTIYGRLESLILSNVSAVENGQNSINSQTNRGIIVSGQNKQVTIIGNNVYDKQETQTQVVGIQVSNSTEELVVTGNNVISYSDSNAYQIPAHATFEGNSVPNYRRGTYQITDGALTTWFNHHLGKVPTKVMITPLGNEKLWISANENNRTQVRRENSTGTVEFMWEVAW